MKLRVFYLYYLFNYLRYRARNLFKPYVFNSPCSSFERKYQLERTKTGFILWTPGVPLKKCGRRIHVSWGNTHSRHSFKRFVREFQLPSKDK